MWMLGGVMGQDGMGVDPSTMTTCSKYLMHRAKATGTVRPFLVNPTLVMLFQGHVDAWWGHGSRWNGGGSIHHDNMLQVPDAQSEGYRHCQTISSKSHACNAISRTCGCLVGSWVKMEWGWIHPP